MTHGSSDQQRPTFLAALLVAKAPWSAACLVQETTYTGIVEAIMASKGDRAFAKVEVVCGVRLNRKQMASACKR